ncbi:DUF397 domain-containing protein [Streptomyces acidiscabies]|uniref:DUF397 domain-containing protein n=1 Tax=Streptomyces acidiscabies TaxID=42234 RepID=UPI0009A0CD0A|nr:DUF397 domain-containing protein [Streptomyces acidiscabies]
MWPDPGLGADREYRDVAGGWEETAVVEESGPVVWWKSSYSDDQTSGGDCCEIAYLPVCVRVRDSKFPERAILSFSFPSWQAAVAYWGENGHWGRP